MPETANFLAYDLGASSGRAVLGRFDGSRVDLEEIHRFPNAGLPVADSLYWDALRLFEEMTQGLRQCVQRHGKDLEGIGIDTWGVDFALLDGHDELLGNPHCYRDSRVQGTMELAFQRVPRDEIFQRTGIQFMEFNTLYQLLAMSVGKSPQLQIARTFLMMPDLLNFWLTGCKAAEFSDATTTQFYDPRRGTWADDVLERLDIPAAMLPDIVPPGTSLGPVRASLAEDVGLRSAEVIAPACHDTGSAVAAVPFRDPDSLYISCGTWALMGTEVTEPVITPSSLTHNFTNEGGVCGTYRFLKNIAGLWLVQECRRTWELQGNPLSYDELTRAAQEARPLVSFVDPDHADFLSPGDMPARIRAYCTRTRQPEPDTDGAVIRCALESLALKFRCVLGQLEEVLGMELKAIHIVGGGIRNTLLCRFTADATGRAVIAGPAEATALGNILMQALARGKVGSLPELREIVRNSTDVITYEPGPGEAWDEAYERFVRAMEQA